MIIKEQIKNKKGIFSKINRKIKIYFFTSYLFCFVCFLETMVIPQESLRYSKIKEALMNMENKTHDSPFGVLEFLSWNHNWNNYYKYPNKETLEKTVELVREWC
ncbi:MAG: hypothetical protein NC820_07240 [Candidatus Omnitrophica bacterium]|nr:hypothetical protein [Candidatus Omnitrophota bacterium]